jgi:hypothetical protein
MLVFFTSDSLTSGFTTMSSLVSVGRTEGAFEGIEEVRDFVLSVGAVGIGGWLIGRLEIDLTSLGLSWARPVTAKKEHTNSAQNDRYEIFFKFFKT